MDPRVVLNRGRDAQTAGRYKDALDDFIWFHEHALEHDQACYGVRLSFALSDWRQLGEVYPPARDALELVRGNAISSLKSKTGNRQLFHDMASINRELDRSRDTYEVFRTLWRHQPDLAKECRHLAVEAVVEAGDFKLAAKCLPHPESYLLWLSERLNEQLNRKDIPRQTAIRRREAYVSIYCGNVGTALRILEGLKNWPVAEAFREWAIALVESPIARRMVTAQLIAEMTTNNTLERQ